MAKANGISRARLEALLTRRGPTMRTALATAVSMSDRALAFALPELRVEADSHAYPDLVKCEVESIGPECPLCASRHGQRISFAQVWSTHDRVVCVDHNMWINGPAFRVDPARPAVKIVGASRADILLAHRRHQRLIRHHGRPTIRQAITDAYDIVEQWNYWRPLEAIGFRLMELEPDETQRGAGTACRNAAMYPEIVLLATVLSDTAWRRRLLVKDRAKRGKAVHDLVELVLDRDTPYRAADPLYEWRLRQLAAKETKNFERSVGHGATKRG
ncbi:hypothetical protein ACNQPY_05060 [Mycobacteroides abscessus]|uniref:hypothetical protein n=1 Tax=Mycobacteroides abscessus TaxID=36809 RepID=UPI003AAD0AB3